MSFTLNIFLFSPFVFKFFGPNTSKIVHPCCHFLCIPNCQKLCSCSHRLHVGNLLWWWSEYGIHQYPDAKNILILCDASGANSYRHHIFKHRLMEFAFQTGLSVIVSHYPPYYSKWNPIEHRLFSQVHKALEGFVFTDYQTLERLIEQTSTKTGLRVVVRLNLKDYQKGIKIQIADLSGNKISHHPEIPELNYRIYA